MTKPKALAVAALCGTVLGSLTYFFPQFGVVFTLLAAAVPSPLATILAKE